MVEHRELDACDGMQDRTWLLRIISGEDDTGLGDCWAHRREVLEDPTGFLSQESSTLNFPNLRWHVLACTKSGFFFSWKSTRQ